MKISILLGLMLLANLPDVFAQSTAFTYQGQLVSGGSPANGNYDFVFGLYTNSLTGSEFGSAETNSAVAVTNGLFITTLNYGSVFSGTNFWLDISVRTNGAGSFTTLTPRQPILAVPYALNVVTGAVSAAQLKTTNAPTAGQVLTWNGTNLFWSTPSGGAF